MLGDRISEMLVKRGTCRSIALVFVLLASVSCGGSNNTESTIVIESPSSAQTFRAGDTMSLEVSLSGFVFNVPPDRAAVAGQGFVGQLQRNAQSNQVQQIDDSRLAHDGGPHGGTDQSEDSGVAEHESDHLGDQGDEGQSSEVGHSDAADEHSNTTTETEQAPGHAHSSNHQDTGNENTGNENTGHSDTGHNDTGHHDTSMMSSSHSHSGNSSNPLARNGHMHIYLDGASGSDVHITTWSYVTEVKLPQDLAPGMHSLRLELRDDAHTIVNPELDEFLYFEVLP